MKKCLKILVVGRVQDPTFKIHVQKKAGQLGLEGILQNGGDQNVIIFVRGGNGDLDVFVDDLYKDISKHRIQNIISEPFTQDKEFRGVFRIIE